MPVNENENSGKSVWCSDAYSSHIKSENIGGKCIIRFFGHSYEFEVDSLDNKIKFRNVKLIPLCKKCNNRAIVCLKLNKDNELFMFLCQEHYMQLKETINNV